MTEPIEGAPSSAYDIVWRMREALEQATPYVGAAGDAAPPNAETKNPETGDPETRDAGTDDAVTAELPESTGTALDGQVEVTFAASHVKSLTINPRAMRARSEDLAEAVRQAVNAAIDENLAALRDGTDVPDLDRLGRELDKIGQDSVRALEE